jgi:hypothetical protein
MPRTLSDFRSGRSRSVAGPLETSIFVGALRCEGLVAPAVLDGAINGDVFLAYVEQILRPEHQAIA